MALLMWKRNLFFVWTCEERLYAALNFGAFSNIRSCWGCVRNEILLHDHPLDESVTLVVSLGSLNLDSVMENTISIHNFANFHFELAALNSPATFLDIKFLSQIQYSFSNSSCTLILILAE
ncbi:hypothetical protein AVEN_166882-1 [Araneus ventricosus]|uniref:Uncharacterized protein n=1 Tax=Araneus ventricosus TaxID=182803 RepID=A0A4Y2H9N8_ARAVE|nr:hypothetical protein AVEN_166882-1 [Araneus ventricosus]